MTVLSTSDGLSQSLPTIIRCSHGSNAAFRSAFRQQRASCLTSSSVGAADWHGATPSCLRARNTGWRNTGLHDPMPTPDTEPKYHSHTQRKCRLWWPPHANGITRIVGLSLCCGGGRHHSDHEDCPDQCAHLSLHWVQPTPWSSTHTNVINVSIRLRLRALQVMFPD
jgi:hypothetical protein